MSTIGKSLKAPHDHEEQPENEGGLSEVFSPEQRVQDGAFIRLIQPDSASAGIEDTSYLRLGGYYSSDPNKHEAKLVTGLATTLSVAIRHTVGAEKNADDAAGKVEAGHDVDPAKRFSTATQAKDTISLEKVKINGEDDQRLSQNNGVLIYTRHDLQENVCGAGLMKYGKGHTVEVSNYDSKYTVKHGAYTLAARAGVVISAGRLSSHEEDAPFANVEITAQGYIKQRAFGDLEETTYGDTRKHTHGNVTDWIVGKKLSRIHGAETSMKLGAVTSLVLGLETNLKLAPKVSLLVSGEINFYLSAVQNYYRGIKRDCIFGTETKIIVGKSFKIVQGNDFKNVMGADFKLANSDTKIVLRNDYKFVKRSDSKIVDQTGTIADKKWEIVRLAIKKEDLKTEHTDLKSSLSKAVTERISSGHVRQSVLHCLQ